ncbi:MAG: GNAT family N-acetyltransferase [Alphaproteobacteria bacterium]|nr:GNAT family N-acetyltransferase [Alphaproteobacteria bacterium]MBU2085114.1 GNAT family N-acetyltransferase [Alphaproteobacteria bacterium]MBU2142045.1 GNAT family N-acetyltransferase [Alphaproteobacteria bacterium]MBU2196937.1 GNAT family N-acetyltransferase [Alphaproteobacteria bacterium]
MSQVGEPIFRLATRGDLDALVRLEEAFPEEDRFNRRTWRRLLAGNTIAHVAEYNGTLAGAAVLLLRYGSRIARLYTLSVCPEMRGKGLASQLMLAGENSAKEKGCDRMRLEARESNHTAILLYERSGYRVIARVADYYPNGETAVRMEKPLGMSLGEKR